MGGNKQLPLSSYAGQFLDSLSAALAQTPALGSVIRCVLCRSPAAQTPLLAAGGSCETTPSSMHSVSVAHAACSSCHTSRMPLQWCNNSDRVRHLLAKVCCGCYYLVSLLLLVLQCEAAYCTNATVCQPTEAHLCWPWGRATAVVSSLSCSAACTRFCGTHISSCRPCTAGSCSGQSPCHAACRTAGQADTSSQQLCMPHAPPGSTCV
jgi:hypothetical protein